MQIRVQLGRWNFRVVISLIQYLFENHEQKIFFLYVFNCKTKFDKTINLFSDIVVEIKRVLQ